MVDQWFRKRSVCFFAQVEDREVLRRIEFYAQDIRILEELGFDVRIATDFAELRAADLYFIWWWTWAFLPLIQARLHGRPSLITGVFNDRNYFERNFPERAIMRLALSSADANVFVSEQEQEWTNRNFSLRNTHYVPLGIDSDVYAMAEVPRGPFCFTMCWMAESNARRKCMFELISAIPLIKKELPHFRFLIGGELRDGGPMLRELAREFGVADSVEFLGKIDVSEKIRLMQTCQMYLQPSRYEGFGLAIAEAMACGAPVVTSRVGAVPEVVGECGEYVDGVAPGSIAAAVTSLALNPRLRQSRSIAGRDRIETQFSLRQRRDGLARIISSLLDDATCPAGGPSYSWYKADVHPR